MSTSPIDQAQSERRDSDSGSPVVANVRVRLATPADAPALIAFNQRMAHETEGRQLPDAIIAAGVHTLLNDVTLGYYVVAEFATEYGTECAGALMVTTEWSDWRNGQFLWIQSVYVRPESRRQGIYRCLYDFVKAHAATDPRICGIRLYVERENQVAQKTYQALGMRQTVYLMYEEALFSTGVPNTSRA